MGFSIFAISTSSCRPTLFWNATDTKRFIESSEREGEQGRMCSANYSEIDYTVIWSRPELDTHLSC
jgi:hypothetical protein